MTCYRIKPYTIFERDRGYVGLYPHFYQDLQVKRWWGWKTLDTEEVPPWVRCYGPIGGCDWQSKFASIGSWGRDGIVTLKGIPT
jgi:hypothetical protein